MKEVCKVCPYMVISDGGFLIGCNCPSPCEHLETGEAEEYFSKTGDQ